jgi:hypothetical protein
VAAARLLGRNKPLVLLLALVALLFWPTEEIPPDEEEETATDTATPQETWPKEDAWREAA